MRVHLFWRLVQYRILTKAEMSIYLAIALGGSLGAMSRYWVSSTTFNWLGIEFPYGTLAVNVLGSLLMGFLTVLLINRFNVSDEIRFGVLAGFLGSFTTFSAFAMDTLYLMESGAMLKSIGYVLISVLFCVFGVWAGLVAAKQIL
jgi:CrcB protein